MQRRTVRVLGPILGLALAAPLTSLAGAPAAQAGTPAAAAAGPTSVTLVGSLQSELGCAGDWAPDCAATHLTAGADGRWSLVGSLPAGSYEFKVAIDDAWTESYGAGGASGGANIPLALSQTSELRFVYDPQTHLTGVASTTPIGGLQPADRDLAVDSLRKNLTREQFYFVMADRFANGSTANDRGGLTGGRSTTGLDPADKAYYHGGDIPGLTSKLDYIKGLGTTSIWLTPSFKNRAVQGSGANESAGYHGYWITDFTQVDPHLGTNADLKSFIDKAHGKGIKVFFDIITNHTADVIQYAEGQNTYILKQDKPYKDADGTVFDDAVYAGKPNFPAMDAKTSFPYTPVFTNPADASSKVPAWLNDPTLYHNRGDSTYTGESATYGDFAGLDDLFTENTTVEKGMEDIYKSWVDFGIDGFRIDTAKHVNMEFWQAWSPEILKHAKDIGNPDFFMFGEVYDANPVATAPYSREGKLPATLDFGFQASARDFADGKPTSGLRDFFAKDDLYTDADSNAYDLPTFLGNHDMGRIGYFLKSDNPGMASSELVARDELAHSLMYLTRGQPVIYYGDEQGFTGAGGGNDQQARQDMFASSVDFYNNDTLIDGTPATSKDRFDPNARLYKHIAGLSKLVKDHPALRDGSQLHRYSSSSAGVYAFSRIDPKDRVEYVVAVNNATTAKTVTIDTLTERMKFDRIYPSTTGTLRAGPDARLTITVPPLSAAVWQAQRRVHLQSDAPTATFTTPVDGMPFGGNAEIGVTVPAKGYNQVTFAYRVQGTDAWTTLGTDDNAPYRVFHDVRGIPQGTLLEYRAVLKDVAGNLSVATSSGIVGQPATPTEAGGPEQPVVQPDSVTVAGDLDSEIGCAADWAPDCAAAHLTRTSGNAWSATFSLPAGSFAYKAALNDSWQENYGAGGVKDGGNIPLVVPAGGAQVTFSYDARTHWITDSISTKTAVAVGSFQSELGCTADWSPDCLASWLQDPDGDGIFTYATTAIPAGSYEGKVAVGLSWDENYGAGGTPGGANIAFTVGADGLLVTFSYNSATHILSVGSASAVVKPDISKQQAFWLTEDLLAWRLGPRAQDSTYRLYSSPSGGLAVDDEEISGGSSIPLTYDPAGIPAALQTKYPQLAGYSALRLPRKVHGSDVEQLLKGQLAVGRFDDLGRLSAASGIQTVVSSTTSTATPRTARSG